MAGSICPSAQWTSTELSCASVRTNEAAVFTLHDWGEWKHRGGWVWVSRTGRGPLPRTHMSTLEPNQAESQQGQTKATETQKARSDGNHSKQADNDSNDSS